MRDAPGVGLAAPQLGEAMQACVIEVENQLYELVNPRIVRSTGDDRDLEGCLSIPGYVAYVTRRERVWVVAQDRHGKKIKVAGSGLLGRALQHELDHLDGKLYIDYLESMDELLAVGHGDDEERSRRGADAGARVTADQRPAGRVGPDRLPRIGRLRCPDPRRLARHARRPSRRRRHGSRPTVGPAGRAHAGPGRQTRQRARAPAAPASPVACAGRRRRGGRPRPRPWASSPITARSSRHRCSRSLPTASSTSIHPRLPRHRGATPIPATILAGDRTAAVTLMRMDEGLDTGPIVAQEAWPLDGTRNRRVARGRGGSACRGPARPHPVRLARAARFVRRRRPRTASR